MNKPKIEVLLPFIHQIGEYLLMAQPNEPTGNVTIGSLHLKYIFNGEEIIQICETDKDDKVVKILFDRKKG